MTLTFSRSLKVNVVVLFDSPWANFYWCLISNTWSNSPPFRRLSLQYLNGLDFDLSRTLKVKCDGAVALRCGNSFWCVISNTLPNSIHLRYSRLQNFSDFDLDLLTSLKSETVPLWPHAKWYTDELWQAKRDSLKLERSWRNSELTVCKAPYRQQYAVVNWLLYQARITYYS